jgi:hypothetical protein
VGTNPGGEGTGGATGLYRDALEEFAADILALIAERPDLPSVEMVAELRKRRIRTSRSSLWRFLDRHDIYLKKILQAAERQRADVARARRRWIRDPPAQRHRCMDNCRVHMVPAIREAIEKARSTHRFLPKYSPNLNPIEMPYSKFKTFLRKVAVRSVPGLTRAIPLFIPQLRPHTKFMWAMVRSLGFTHRIVWVAPSLEGFMVRISVRSRLKPTTAR